MDKKIKEILKYGVMAPSGDNSQPWSFVIENETLKIYNLPERDNPFLNYMQSGSLIAHGALIKNIEIASLELGLKPIIKLLPNTKDQNLVAEIIFEDTDINSEQPLFEFIPKRSTNRRPYQNSGLSESESSLLHNSDLGEDLVLKFITSAEDKKVAGAAGSSAEIIILENTLLHEYLFKDVMWSKEQENRERHGLYIKTMEFNPIQRFLFKLASNKKLMKIAVKIGFPHFIAKEDAVLYSTGATIGLLSLRKVTPENFIKLGMEMQNIWLKATSLGLSFQPVTATLFLGFILKNNKDGGTLNEKHKEIAMKSYQEIRSVFKLKEDETPFFMFRIGRAQEASARSSRKDPVIEIRNT